MASEWFDEHGNYTGQYGYDKSVIDAINANYNKIATAINKSYDLGAESVKGFYKGSENAAMADVNAKMSSNPILASAIRRKYAAQGARDTSQNIATLEKARTDALAQAESAKGTALLNEKMRVKEEDKQKKLADQQFWMNLLKGAGSLAGQIGTAAVTGGISAVGSAPSGGNATSWLGSQSMPILPESIASPTYKPGGYSPNMNLDYSGVTGGVPTMSEPFYDWEGVIRSAQALEIPNSVNLKYEK